LLPLLFVFLINFKNNNTSHSNIIHRQGIVAYCVIKTGYTESAELENELRLTVRKIVGPFAAPDIIILAPGLPKTRSGKIMRRILRKIAAHESSPEQLGGILSPFPIPSSLSPLSLLPQNENQVPHPAQDRGFRLPFFFFCFFPALFPNIKYLLCA
jgi:hypothetical protein